VPLTRRPPAPAASAVAALALAALVGCPSAEPGADDVGPRDAGPSADAGTAPDAGAPPACERPSGPGATHDTDVAADEVWRAADGPHTVPRNIRVLATLRVEPCAQVLLGPNVRLTVGDDTSPAALEAQGTATQPITFGAVDAARPWTGLIVSQSGRLDLGHVTISDAASPADDQNGGGAILAYGDRRAEGAINRSVKVTNVRVERARGHAVAFVGAAGFAEGSSGLTLADGGRPERPQALRLPIAAAPTIPTNLSIGGYPSGAVALVAGNGGLPGDVEIPARGAPYHVEAVIRVAPTADGPPVTLTIGAGVVMRFDPTNGTSGIAVGSTERRQGILRAIGTEAAPIQLTSAKDPPAPADWHNIIFNATPPTGNLLEHVTLSYAGAPSGAQGYGCGPAGNDGAIVWLAGRPDAPFLARSALRSTGGDTGVVLGWRSDLDGPDVVSTNTFVDVPACRVSRWRAEDGGCPGSVGGAPVCL
jgi:hypothetical protein